MTENDTASDPSENGSIEYREAHSPIDVLIAHTLYHLDQLHDMVVANGFSPDVEKLLRDHLTDELLAFREQASLDQLDAANMLFIKFKAERRSILDAAQQSLDQGRDDQ